MFGFLENTNLNDIKNTDFEEYNNNMTKMLEDSIILLQSEDEKNIERAEYLINLLIDKQDNNPGSQYYGLWLRKENFGYGVIGDYDQNMTTYIGIPLFVLLAEYSHLLSEELIKKTEHSLSIACVFILNRNIHLQNTHITIAESFLTAACGERFHSPEFTNYALNLFQHFYHYNIAQGNVTEYNTTAYDINNLYVLHLAKKYIKNALFLQLTDTVSDIIWEITATHYHYQTRNFAGPSHRMGEALSQEENALFTHEYNVKFFSNACKSVKKSTNKLNFYDICPQKYRRYFNGTTQNEYSQKIISQGSSYPYYFYSRIATTLIKPDFCIGSFCRGECWNEEAALLGYFGTQDSPFAIKVTALHDEHEYASAQLSMVQHMNYILGHTTFATNRGDKHIDHDLNNGKLHAKDLRIRFLICGDISRLSISRDKNTIDIRYNNVYIKLEYLLAKFSGYSPTAELTAKDGYLFFDMIIYKGKLKTINLNEIKKAVVSWMFCISDKEIPHFTTENTFQKKYLVTKAFNDTFIELMLESYYKPDTHENIHVNNKQYIQGILFEKYVRRNSNMMQQYSYIIDYNPESPFDLELQGKENITALIYSLMESAEEELIADVKKIFSLIYKNNITLMLVKRLAIQIISQIFEFYREKNITFEIVIQNNSQLYLLRISSAPDTEHIAYYVFELLKLMHSNFVSFTESRSDIDLIEQITSLIDEEYSNPNLSREYIAQKCKVSIFAVSRAFKNTCNMKYIDYLTNVRITHAKEYLTNSKLTPEEIALKVGYLNISSFIRTFKKKTGETPSKFRNTQKKY